MYQTLCDTYYNEAAEYLLRAVQYRINGNIEDAEGCEKNALRKIKKADELHHWWQVREKAK